jgi:hypothetical protein
MIRLQAFFLSSLPIWCHHISKTSCAAFSSSIAISCIMIQLNTFTASIPFHFLLISGFFLYFSMQSFPASFRPLHLVAEYVPPLILSTGDPPDPLPHPLFRCSSKVTRHYVPLPPGFQTSGSGSPKCCWHNSKLSILTGLPKTICLPTPAVGDPEY